MVEVSCIEQHGLPDGCLLSVRAGNVRGQAPLGPGFKLRFPEDLKGMPFLLDFLAPIGYATMNLEPGVERYDVPVGLDTGAGVAGAGADMRVRLKVSEASGAAEDSAEGAAAPAEIPLLPGALLFEKPEMIPEDKPDAGVGGGAFSRRHRAALSARRYLDEHSLLSWAQVLFQDIIQDQPADPWAYIDEKTDEFRRKSLGLAPAARSPARRRATPGPMSPMAARTAPATPGPSPKAMPTDSKASARLLGMNIVRILDVDGSGTIDAAVLANSLKQFDSTVFSDESMRDLLGMCGEIQDGRVLIQDFAAAIGAPSQMTRTAKSLRAYMDGLVCNVESFREVLNEDSFLRTAGGTSKDLSVVKADLKKKAKEHMLQAQRRHIRPLWDAFDKDRDGVLSPDECKRLVGAYLHEMVHRCGDIVQGTIKLGVELSVVLFEKQCDNLKAREHMRAKAKAQVDALTTKVAPLIKEMMERMEKEDPGEIAAELLETLDMNKDGKVTRDEFESHFLEGMQLVLGPEALMDKLHKHNSIS
mmetsp:Transcript_60033/g.128833  ORF Transcript_60033/g.128833 Transcript_60033/m.128833 type:complete len:530 (-) Transcript_60033:204-1793(-)